MRRSLLLAASLVSSLACARPAEPPRRAAPAEAEPAVRGLANIQRTLRLLRESTPARRHPVRVLLYGQSITQAPWTRHVARTLHARFPHADLHVENRALGGYHAQLLAKTAESDLYPFYPDLVIFHVYGDHTRYEEIVRKLRERTTAEVLLQTDHPTSPADLTEETREERLAPDAGSFSASMNHRFLPGLVAPHQVALCDQRAAWKRHLQRRALSPADLLSDEVHLNARGDRLMASLVESCLRGGDEGVRSPAEDWVTTYTLGDTVEARGDTLDLPFEGNRIDAITRSGRGGALTVRIDGQKPSEHASLYAFARAHTEGAGKWPPVYDLGSDAKRVLETFHLEVERVQDEPPVYGFRLTGDVTGFDGEGRSDQRFVSRSRRVVIEPDDWMVEFAFMLAGTKPVPARFRVDVRVEPHFTDAFAAIESDPARERVVTLAQGLSNGRHALALRGDLSQLVALRVYRPPGGRAQ